jgi:putative colanic acid biosynthesis UDP-glucose lipid carrier transferase
MTVNDIPVVAFFKRLLDPFMIWGLLILITRIYDETFTGYYMVLVIITFFISSYIYEQTHIYRAWRNGKLLC